jgi:hypothetical protein
MWAAAMWAVLAWGGQRLDPPDAAPRTRMENGRLVYQLGETRFAFRLSKGRWKDLAEGVYWSGGRVVAVAPGRSVRYEDAIEAQSRAVGAMMHAIEQSCPRQGQCRMSPQAWKRFERYAWLDAAQGEFRLMLRIEGARFSVSRKGAADYTKQLRQWLGREGRILPEEETKP